MFQNHKDKRGEPVRPQAEQLPILFPSDFSAAVRAWSVVDGDEEHVCAQGETDISRKLTNPHRALQTTRQSNIRTTTLIF